MNSKIFGTVAVLLFATPALAYDPAGTPADWPSPMGGAFYKSLVSIDRLEATFADEEGESDYLVWDVAASWGTDFHQLVIETEGRQVEGEDLEEAEIQLLYGYTFSPYWMLLVGGRHGFKPEPEQTFWQVTLHGEMPYRIEMDVDLLVSDDGDPFFAAEAEYDYRLTQSVVLQGRWQASGAIGAVAERNIDSGLSEMALGLRLRYELHRKFAPYIGISWQRLYGNEAAERALAGGDDTSTQLVLGVKAWF